MSSDRQWRIAIEQHDDGLRRIFRVRNLPPSGVNIDAFPIVVTVIWSYRDDNGTGMPSANVTDLMNRFEDLVRSAVEDSGHAFLAAVITGLGTREWRWCSQDSDNAVESISQISADHPEFAVECFAAPDPDWYANYKIGFK